jgi:hypothetical protein
MTQEERAALREAAQAVIDTQGHDHACLAYMKMMSGMHPAAVLALLDECERLREALAWYAKDYDYDKGCSQWDGGTKARAALSSEPGA